MVRFTLMEELIVFEGSLRHIIAVVRQKVLLRFEMTIMTVFVVPSHVIILPVVIKFLRVSVVTVILVA